MRHYLNSGDPMAITALYAGLLAPLLAILMVRVAMMRQRTQVEIGDNNDPALLRRIRAHGNFIETAPYALIVMALAESLGAYPIALHVSGLALLVGRVLHAIGLSHEPHHILALRASGIMLTLGSILLSAALCLWLALQSRAGLLSTIVHLGL